MISHASSKRARDSGQRHAVDVVLARDAAGEAGDHAPVRQAVEHRQLFGQPQRVVDRQQVAVDQQLEALGALRGGCGHAGWASSSGRRATCGAR